MAELYLIRHAQASFGTDDYDKLSDLGHEQSFALGKALVAKGLKPDSWMMGEMRRQQETLEGIRLGMGQNNVKTEIHHGLNEFDFKGLLNAHFKGKPAPAEMHTDRKTHFRTLRETILAWQKNEVKNPPETWSAFTERVENAKQFIRSKQAETVIALSSGGAIAQMVSSTLQTPATQQIKLQLQMKNCAISTFIFTTKAFYLNGFNETPHITEATQRFLTYS